MSTACLQWAPPAVSGGGTQAAVLLPLLLLLCCPAAGVLLFVSAFWGLRPRCSLKPTEKSLLSIRCQGMDCYHSWRHGTPHVLFDLLPVFYCSAPQLQAFYQPLPWPQIVKSYIYVGILTAQTLICLAKQMWSCFKLKVWLIERKLHEHSKIFKAFQDFVAYSICS